MATIWAILATGLLSALLLDEGIGLNLLIADSLGSGTTWAWRGVRDRADGTRGRWLPVLRTGGVAVLLLVVFGALLS
ncbi:hypothetical protein EAO71_06080 [Streptomyces sp. ms191]|uniref:hypothetical protein n=1 Tax=Streptomyces sp. ms191 TaxID=1827978 RepID=UPI0011CEBAA4|nr:hypothetical protein [Streptomyces sp. ms191]TXS31705.1 hypothetical protein EAO71_06080 [Streptomyces sp. ms191]